MLVTLFKSIGIKNIIIFVVVVILGTALNYYVNKYRELTADLALANKNNELMIEAYELTIKIEREISSQKAVTTVEKEIVVTKYKTLVKEIEKRGEIKKDEKSNFTIVTF